jgi:ethanolamine utilization protein EutA
MASDAPKKPAHSLADHAFGAFSVHAHAPGEEADHDHDADDNLVLDPRENTEVPLVSIGVDIGSSGTQVVFSRILMRGPGEPLAMRRQAKSRETLFMSPVAMTPFNDDGRTINGVRLRAIVDRAYVMAGITPDDVETGVVIMTGAAARRDNSAAIMDALSEEGGELVSAAAGDHMEALLAAHGAGAVEASRRDMSRILNIDVGGATTKFALIDKGRVLATAALRVGGRLVAFDLDDRIVRLDADGAEHAARAGVLWRREEIADKADMQKVADAMAEMVAAAITRSPLPENVREAFLTEPIGDLGALDGVMFSGGVAEYVYLREKRDFGDLGWRLGRALRRRFDAGDIPWPLLPPGECIRATALGASQFGVQMSGATSCITSHAALLPRRNLPVLSPPCDFRGDIDVGEIAAAIGRHRTMFDDDDPTREAALALRWRGEPSFERVRALAGGIAQGMADRIAAGTNLYVMLEGDVALTLGAILKQDMGLACEILVIDGITLRDFDYVDIGRIRMPSGMVPVTVKSLVFGGAGQTIAAGNAPD